MTVKGGGQLGRYFVCSGVLFFGFILFFVAVVGFGGGDIWRKK